MDIVLKQCRLVLFGTIKLVRQPFISPRLLMLCCSLKFETETINQFEFLECS